MKQQIIDPYGRVEIKLYSSLMKYDYPPENYDSAISTVISQCELWTDHADMEENVITFHKPVTYSFPATALMMAAETIDEYRKKN